MIGLIGGYGDVGLQAARVLNEWGKHSLRIGGRNPEMARIKLGNEFYRADWKQVDIDSDQSLEEFVHGCKLIINCAGPSHRLTAKAARICLVKGCHYVDAGINTDLENMRGSLQKTVVLYAAGAMPGLSGLLPRWMAEAFDKVESLVCYSGHLDKFTTSAAEDYLAGASGKGNKALMSWKNGSIQPSAFRRKESIKLPFFSREVILYPYFDEEAKVVAELLALCDGEWYIASDGSHVSSILEEVCPQFLSDSKAAVKRLCTASELDAAGRRKYINFIFQISGMLNGARITQTLALQAERPAVLTGLAAAAAGIAVAEGQIPPGVRAFAEIPEPEKVITRLGSAKGINFLKVVEGSVEQMLQTVEGEL